MRPRPPTRTAALALAALVGLVGLGLVSLSLPAGRAESGPAARPIPLEQAGGLRYSATPSSGPAPLTVLLDASQTGAAQTGGVGAGGTLSVRWLFPDGTSATGSRVSRTFYRPGRYPVRLEASSPAGGHASGELTVTAESAGPEEARATVLPDLDGTVLFDASQSLVYGPAPAYRWSFGDGTSATGPRVSRSFAGPGRSSVKLTVTGPSGPLERSFTLVTGPVSGGPGFEARVLELTNAARERGWDCATLSYRGRAARQPPLVRRPALDRAARAQSAAMALNGYFEHRSPIDGSTSAERATASGYRWSSVGENIATGQPGPEAAVDAWLHSPGHCRAITSPDFLEIGLSYVRAPDGRPYWTQVFGRP